MHFLKQIWAYWTLSISFCIFWSWFAHSLRKFKLKLTLYYFSYFLQFWIFGHSFKRPSEVQQSLHKVLDRSSLMEHSLSFEIWRRSTQAFTDSTRESKHLIWPTINADTAWAPFQYYSLTSKWSYFKPLPFKRFHFMEQLNPPCCTLTSLNPFLNAGSTLLVAQSCLSTNPCLLSLTIW